MTRRVQLCPPSKDTPSNRPLGTSGRVDMVTMFDGLAGLMAIASSASLPCMALESKFGGTGGTGAAAGAVAGASSAMAVTAGAETARIRSMRRFTLASPHWAPHRKTGPRYGAAQAIGKRPFQTTG